MPVWANSAKRALRRPFVLFFHLLRFALACACTYFFAPYAVLGIFVGSDIIADLNWGWPVGLLFFVCGLSGVIGLLGYLVCVLGYQHDLNAPSRVQIATSFALAGGVPPAALLVVVHCLGVGEVRGSSLQADLPIWLLTLLLVDAIGVLIVNFSRKQLRKGMSA